MTLYTTNSKHIAAQCKLLISLNANCAKMRWDNKESKLPSVTIRSLTHLEESTNEMLNEMVSSLEFLHVFSEKEESEMMCSIKSSVILRLVLGSGVILAGEMADLVITELEKNTTIPSNVKTILCDALRLDKNLILI